MNSKKSIESFFYISPNKLSLCIFEDIDQKIFEKEVLVHRYEKKENLNNIIDEFLDENIVKIERKIGMFINEINLVVLDKNFIKIQASIKKNGKSDKISSNDISRMLFDLKQQIKENNSDKTITHMRINNFLLDKKKYYKLDDNFKCNELCLQIDFICLSNKTIHDFSEKIKKYQISIDKIFSAEYLKDNYNSYDGNECFAAANFKHENDENEVHFKKKMTTNTGFFERFFRFFG